jgi:hypothetical protein
LCVQKEILATLAYFDIFDYPLTQTEIFLFLGGACSQHEFAKGLSDLTEEGWIHKYEDLYTLQEELSLVTRRRKGNLAA